MVIPTVVYDHETWKLKVKERGKLEVFDMSLLRDIYEKISGDRINKE